nr:MAG TPA: Ellis van Creveld protein 2 like protein [Caudoviricetes sp.]
MDELGGFIVGFIVATIVTTLTIAWNMVASERIIMKPIKDEHKNEILYYVDIYTNKEYKMENDILYYYEED